jgi:ribonuclease Y
VELLLVFLLVVLIAAVGILVVLVARTARQWSGGGPAPESSDRTVGTAESAETGELRRQALDDRQAAAAELTKAEADAEALRVAAERHAEVVRSQADAVRTAADVEARAVSDAARADAEHELRQRVHELELREERLVAREERLSERMRGLDEEAHQIETREHDLARMEAEIARGKAELVDLEQERHRVLERVAGMTAAEARVDLVKEAEQQAKRDAALLVRDIEASAREEGEDRARKIVTLAIQRVASEQTAESVVSVLHLPSDEMKGRIIGREGRNIRAYEAVTGVNVIIDDTPEAVLLSCFDPVRREVGRLTLEALVLDGRIHPQRIEEQYERAKVEVDALCVRAGEDALVAVGLHDMHPDLIALLGRLRYRTSYGQNVLKHLVESAHLAGVMAHELRLPAPLAKRGTLLHDIGKALTHEVEGSHALIGAELARRYEEDEDVVHAIEAHHNEVEPRTIGAVLTQAADQISGGRPGARRESLESYVKRLERIEQIASEKPGVDKVFAMQAGREVRVMVVPDAVDDIGAQVLARDVAKQIEDELTYPGQIRVTVVRETRSTEIAR